MSRSEKSGERSDLLRQRLAAIEHETAHQDAVKQRQTPKGWEAGVVWEGTTGVVTTGALDAPPQDWSDLLAERGLDPDRYEIVGDTVRWTSWDGWKRDDEGTTYSALCYSFRADLRLRGAINAEIPEDLYLEARKAKPAKRIPDSGDNTFMVLLSDWQIGNMDGGGVEEQVLRLAELSVLLKNRVSALRKSGRHIGEICIAGLGDLGEGTCGFYPAQKFRVQVDRREQRKITRRAVRDIVMDLAPLAERITVTAVPGNHGENRDAGKSFTTPGDNDDVAIFEEVAEILAVNPEAFGHVGFRLPLEQIAISLNLSDHIVAFTHGHIPRPSGGAINAMWNWWKNQAHGRAIPGVADADILCAGHFHHLNVKEQEGRVLIIAPSLTRVGDYYQNQHGVMTRPGTLTFCLGPQGWTDLAVI